MIRALLTASIVAATLAACGSTSRNKSPSSQGGSGGQPAAWAGAGAAGASDSEAGGGGGGGRAGASGHAGAGGEAFAGVAGELVSQGGQGLSGSSGSDSGGEAGEPGRVFEVDRAACGAMSCPANFSASGDPYGPHCCYWGAGSQCADLDNNQCTPPASGARALFCDSTADCVDEGLLCVFDVGNLRAMCDGPNIVDGVDYVQLCDPDADTCTIGTCQPTTLNDALPPQYYGCLP